MGDISVQVPESEIQKLKTHTVHHTVRGSLIAAIFMMATSAIGPGFITQTATFTITMGAAFAFAILISIIIDFIVQINVWRIVILTRKRAAEIANDAIPGSGYLLAALVIFGGLVFNIGNIAGAGLGLNAMIGLDSKWGGMISAILAIFLFTSKKLRPTTDRLIVSLGILMIAMTLYVALMSHPPAGNALLQTVWLDRINFATITTIIGGSVGGYITYAGAHRLLDSNTTGPENIHAVTRGALSGIIVTGIMRYLLFLAVLGVVAGGAQIAISGADANPAAQAFQIAVGDAGLRIFGLILWAASITSIIGAAYTSITFISVFKKDIKDHVSNMATVIFIAIGLAVFVLLGTAPVALLVFAGGFNGFILPIGLTIFIYIGWARADLMGGYRYSRVLLIFGAVACLLTWYMGAVSIKPIFDFLRM